MQGDTANDCPSCAHVACMSSEKPRKSPCPSYTDAAKDYCFGAHSRMCKSESKETRLELRPSATRDQDCLQHRRLMIRHLSRPMITSIKVRAAKSKVTSSALEESCTCTCTLGLWASHDRAQTGSLHCSKSFQVEKVAPPRYTCFLQPLLLCFCLQTCKTVFGHAVAAVPGEGGDFNSSGGGRSATCCILVVPAWHPAPWPS